MNDEQIGLEEAFAEWTDESLTMANDAQGLYRDFAVMSA